ncbi:MAG: TonB-dependent receptor [Spirochaetes bacterium]|nr:TonB-dependent receptor [Spirochaetota bacterium]
MKRSVTRHSKGPVVYIYLLSLCLGCMGQEESNAQESNIPSTSSQNIVIRVVDSELKEPLVGVRVYDPASGITLTTDLKGSVTFQVQPPLLVFSLPGYEEKRLSLRERPIEREIEVSLRVSSVLEGEELVIEAPSLGKSDEQVGVSIVVDKEMVKHTAQIGIMEDVLNTVRILPGVIYAGRYTPSLSVRGGEPGGLTHVLDGALIKYPYHWGGMVSIFNPRIVDSVKLSAGIFPVEYGQATSGLLDINLVTPNDGLKWEVGTSISTLEGYGQIPLMKNNRAGLLVGSRITHYDLVFALTGNFLEDQGLTFSRVPYIYDFYLKGFYQPNKELSFQFNGFVGQDGIGVKALEPDIDLSREIQNTFDFEWTNWDAFLHGTIQWLPGDRVAMRMLLGYENWVSQVEGRFLEKGSRFYSDAFIDRFGSVLGVQKGDFFSVDAESDFTTSTTLHHIQLRLDANYLWNDRLTLKAGGGAYLSLFRYDSLGDLWGISYLSDGTPVYRKDSYSSRAEDNNIWVSFAYLGGTWAWIPSRLTIEGGLRIDHGYFQGEESFTLNTAPVLGPRLLAFFTPSEAIPLTLSAGSGIFSKVPFESLLLTRDMGLSDYDVKIPKSFISVLGGEIQWEQGFRFKIETYYKYLYDRFYFNMVPSTTIGSSRELKVRAHNDGIGHAGGFDILLDQRTSRHMDGMVSYSFIVARYKNPTTDGIEEENPTEPRGRWYYPTFHRFHSLNILVNYKPSTWFTLTTRLSFASGTPLPRFGDKEMFFARFENKDGSSTLAELYTRKSYYDDLNRHSWILPLDVKATFHFYRSGSKVYHELYLGAEDILSPLYTKLMNRRGAVTTDRYTGEDTDSPEAQFSFPVVSIGYRASY